MIPRRLLFFAGTLFFLSGAAGLTYEVIWFKRFAHVWGSSALAAASVLAAYLLGLGAGARYLGRLADRVRSPLSGYGWCEVGIAALALLVPAGIGGLERIAAALYPYLADHPLLGALVRALLTLLVIGPPCFLMGGTFPLLVKELTPAGGTLREATGILYAINTLGGAAGAYLAGFHLLPALGLSATNYLAAAVNVAAGAVALAAARFLRRRTDAEEPLAAPPAPVPDGPAVRSAAAPAPAALNRPIFAAALLSGAASLALQIAWTRQLSLILGGSTYAFSAMLLVVLAGIGLGSLIFHLWLRRTRDPARLQAAVTLALLLSALAGQLLIEPATVTVGAVRTFRASPLWNAAISAAAALAIELLASVGMGILLPLYAAATGKGAREAGTTTGNLYAWNTAGTIAGALGAALYLLPSWGLSATVASALSLYLFAAIILYPSRGLRNKLALLAITVAGVALVHLASRGPDPALTNLGMYLYGEVDPVQFKKSARPLFIEEGISSNVMVTLHQDGMVSLRVNGKVDASTAGDMTTQLGLAYFPRFFHPQAVEVLVIGLGSGTTSGASLLFPAAQVTCAEIEPAVVRAAGFFGEVNHRPLESPRFRLVLNDGRWHLQGTRSRYDLIISEPSNPWIAGVSNLFTREFYLAARERLAPGGVLAQWIQSYSLSTSDFALVVRTIRQVFPHGALLRASPGDAILLASTEPLEPGREALDRGQALVDSLPPVKADLEKHFGTAEVRTVLLGRRLLADRGLERFLAQDGGRTLHTDLNLRLEFDAPLRLFDESLSANAVRKALLAASDTSAFAETWTRWGCSGAHLPALRAVVDFYTDHEEWELAQQLIGFGLGIDPRDAHLLASRFLTTRSWDEKAWEEEFSRIVELSSDQAARIGVSLYVRKDFPRAIRIWKRLLESHPQSATLWVNLVSSLEAAGKKEEAAAAMEKARLLDPFSSFVRSRSGEKAEEGAGR